ncbi:phosphopantetheine-binding protein [Amycolatopsis nivea]
MTIAPGVPRDHRWIGAAAARVARAVGERGLAGSRLGVRREPDSRFAALVLGCVRAGATVTVLDPESPVAPEFLGVSAVLSPADFLDGTPDAADPAAPFDAPAWTGERITADDRVCVLSGHSGQIVSAIACAVASGATLRPDSPPVTDLPAVAEWLAVHAISVVFTTPPVLRALAAGDRLPGTVRQAIVENTGGLLVHDVEALRRAAPACALTAAYRTGRDGRPLAVHDVPPDWDTEDAPLWLPAGIFRRGADVRLLTAAGKPASFGEIGALVVDGVPCGDQLRRWPDGSLEFAGPDRDADETAAAVRELPDVRDATTAERFGEDGEPVLVAYAAGPGPDADPAALRRMLATRLAQPLMPARLVLVPELPLTAAGAYDLDALPDPDPGEDRVAPRTPLEEQLTVMLCELLKTEQIGVFDSFFELGGFSLLATQLATRIRESFGVEPSLLDIFGAPTVDGLAQLIVRRQLELSGSAELEALLAEIERTES